MYSIMFFMILIVSGITVQSKDFHAVPGGRWRDEIHFAALKGDGAKIQDVINNKGVDVDLRDSDGRTALDWAAVRGEASIVQLLLNKGADAGSRDNQRQTPLHKAARWGNSHIVPFLIKREADVDAQDNNGQTPLHMAENAQTVKELVKYGAQLNVQDYLGKTALHEAVLNGRKDVVRELVALGVDLGLKDSFGKTAADLTDNRRKGKSLKRYLKRQKLLSEQLLYATQVGDILGMQNAINKGASLNVADAVGNTPLHLAVKSGNLLAVEILLYDISKINFRLRNNQGKTAVEEAAYRPEMKDFFAGIIKKIVKE